MEQVTKNEATDTDVDPAAARKLMLIDGHSMAFRAFYALPAENFSTDGGQHTNAVYGFVSMLVGLLSAEKPTHVAVAFDVGRHTFRSDLFPDYKAQRDATPPEFKGQVDFIKKILSGFGITSIEKPNFEADDIIATLATQAGNEGFDTLIVTGDRDSFQLVNDHTTVLFPVRGVSETTRFTPAAVKEKYGVDPAHYPDVAALRGDKSDNLPNIPGVGPVTATKWIDTYGSLDELLAHADEMKTKAGKALAERVEQVRLNRRLTEMVKDLDLPVAVSDLVVDSPDEDTIQKVFDQLQFNVNLRTRVLSFLGCEDETDPQSVADKPHIVVDDENVTDWLTDERARAGIAVATVGTSTPGAGDVTALGLVASDGHGVAIDVDNIDVEAEKTLADWLASPTSPKYFHDAKASWHMLVGRGFVLKGVAHDTAIADYLLRPGQRTYELESVYERHCGRPLNAPSKSDEATGQLSLLDSDVNPAELVATAGAIMELATVVTGKLEKIDAWVLYTDIELPLMDVLARMEHTGITVDVDELKKQSDGFADKINREEQAARDIAEDPDLNLSSPKQLQVVLFEKLDMPKTKKTKTGYSTAAKELEQLAAKTQHPFLEHLMAHREYQKMKSTIDGLIKSVADDGRIHTTFNQTATSTGRLSSTDPNLQNIPVRTQDGKRIRGAFTVSKGFDCLLTADYSQIEMRVMAHLSNDAGLVAAYNNGEDLHNYVGSQVFDVPVSEVTPELRRKVKAMSYGLVYGLSAFGLAGQLGITPGEAKDIMSNYFERFGGVKDYLEGVVAKARSAGYTQTIFGRRRYLPELSSTNRVIRENAERAALNAPIQGSAADIIKVAMLKVDRALTREKLSSRVLLQVHDELVVEVAHGECDVVTELVANEMDSAIALRVPLEVSTGHGDNWDATAH